MKSFKDYLTESKKTYPFKIGVAGPLDKGFADKLESALEKFGVVKLSPGKKTPIQERPLDFPQLQNMEVTYFETELNYPTTQAVLQEYLGRLCEVGLSHIVVRNPNEPIEQYQAEQSDEPYEALLNTEELGGECGQALAGNNRVMDLLKELEVARKERTNDPIASVTAGDVKQQDNSQQTKSVIGN